MLNVVSNMQYQLEEIERFNPSFFYADIPSLFFAWSETHTKKRIHIYPILYCREGVGWGYTERVKKF